MKKIFVALSVLAMVAFVAVPCQALIGMPDAVPGSKTIIPFWIVDIAATAGPFENMVGNTTLVTLTEVGGMPAFVDPGTGAMPGKLHLKVFTQRSKKVHDEEIPYTKYDVVGIDFGKIIHDNLAQSALDDLLVDLDGDGTADHYMGYATVEDLNFPEFDHWIAHLYQLDLGGGEAAGVVIPVKENDPGPCLAYDDGDGYEAFNADALWAADTMIAGLGCGTATDFRLMPRYFILDEATGASYLIVWQSQNLMIPLGAVTPFTAGGELHVWWYDEEENRYSSNIDIPNEVNLINIEYNLPGGLKGDYPWAGWCDLLMPDSFLAATPWTTATEMLAYSWQLAQGSAAESWSVLFDVHRDADGTVAQP